MIFNFSKDSATGCLKTGWFFRLTYGWGIRRLGVYV